MGSRRRVLQQPSGRRAHFVLKTEGSVGAIRRKRGISLTRWGIFGVWECCHMGALDVVVILANPQLRSCGPIWKYFCDLVLVGGDHFDLDDPAVNVDLDGIRVNGPKFAIRRQELSKIRRGG